MRFRRGTQSIATGIDRLNLVLGLTSGLILAVLMIMLVVDVVLRATTGMPFPGTVGLAQVGLALLVFLALPYTQAQGYNIRVELLLSRLSGRARQSLELINRIIVLVISACVAWAAIPAALRSIALNETERGVVPIPVWPVRVALAVCAFLVVVAVAREFIWHREDDEGIRPDAQFDPDVRRL